MNATSREPHEAIMELKQLESVVIGVKPGGFTWQLVGDGGRKVVDGFAGADQIAAMLQVTEVLLNTEFGIREARLVRADLN
jgi:hypothetical protein